MANETVKAGLEWTTAGVEKLEALNAKVKELETRLGSGVPTSSARTTDSLGKVSSAAVPGGEKLARYGTTVGLLTGQMQRLGVQNELVARGVTLVSEGFTGMLGPIGLATVAIGGVVTYIISLATEQKRLTAEIDASIDALIRFKALKGDAGGMAGEILLKREDQLVSDRASLTAKLEEIRRKYQAGGELHPSGFVDASGKPLMQFSEYNLGKLEKEAVETYNKLALVENKLRQILAPSMTEGPNNQYQNPNSPSGGLEAALTRRIFGPTPGEAQSRYGGGRFAVGGQGAMGLPGEMVSGKTPEQLRVDAAQESYASLSQMQRDYVDLMSGEWDKMSGQGQLAYRSIAGVAQSTSLVTSKIVSAALAGENLSRMRGLDIAKAVAAGSAAAVIRGLGEQASKKAAFEMAEALATWGTPAMAKHLAAGAAFSALAGGASAVAASIESKASASLERATSTTVQDSGRMVSSSATANPGARAVTSGAAPGTINYNVIITYQGAVVYGSGGAEEFYRSEVLPRIRESQSIGELG